MDVLCYSEDETLIKKDLLFLLLEIEELNVIEGEKWRVDDGVPTIKLGKTQSSQKLVALIVTSVF